MQRFLIFRHIGRLWSPNSGLGDRPAAAECETFWRVESILMPFVCKTEHFFPSTLPKSIDAKIEIGANCETFWRLSPQKHRV